MKVKDLQSLNKQQIFHLLPHRDPFLFCDQASEISNDQGLIEWTVTPAEFFFKGHFPEKPILPGVILAESMIQAGAIIILVGDLKLSCPTQEVESLTPTATGFLAKIQNLTFLSPVYPGAQISHQARITKRLKKFVTIHVESFEKEKKVASGDFILVYRN